MVMETRSDNIIQEKINSLNNLPEGYSPNLNSKWELLQAGLKPEQNKRLLLFYVKQASAIAAMLLLIGGSGLLIIKKIAKPTVASIQTTKPEKTLTTPKVLQIKKVLGVKKMAKSPQKHKRKAQVNSSTQVVISTASIGVITPIQKTNIVEQPLINAEVTEQVAVATERFMEVDFTKPLLAPTAPTDVIVKAQKFRFKLGIGNNNQVNIHPEKSAVLKLSTGL